MKVTATIVSERAEILAAEVREILGIHNPEVNAATVAHRTNVVVSGIQDMHHVESQDFGDSTFDRFEITVGTNEDGTPRKATVGRRGLSFRRVTFQPSLAACPERRRQPRYAATFGSPKARPSGKSSDMGRSGHFRPKERLSCSK